MGAYNYAAAFVAFSQGSVLPDISIQLGIPIKTLEQTARQQGWSRLTNKLKTAMPSTAVEVSLDYLKRNREKSLKETEPLEYEFQKIIEINERLREELKKADLLVAERRAELDAAMVDYGQEPTPEAQAEVRNAQLRLTMIVEAQQELLAYLASPKRYKELAQGLAQVQEIRYRAVGDLPNVQPGAKPDAGKTLTQININMPSIVAGPRQVADTKVVELPPSTD